MERRIDPTVVKTDELHRRVVARMRHDPSIIVRARALLDRWIQQAGGEPLPAQQEWRIAFEMLDAPELMRFLESTTPRARRMKISSPFPAVLRD